MIRQPRRASQALTGRLMPTPLRARPVCLCLPLPAQKLSSGSLQTPQGCLMSGKRISRQAHPRQTSLLFPFLIMSIWAISGVCVEKVSSGEVRKRWRKKAKITQKQTSKG